MSINLLKRNETVLCFPTESAQNAQKYRIKYYKYVDMFKTGTYNI